MFRGGLSACGGTATSLVCCCVRTYSEKPPCLRELASEVEEARLPAPDCIATEGAAELCLDHLLTGVERFWAESADGPVEGDNSIEVDIVSLVFVRACLVRARGT